MKKSSFKSKTFEEHMLDRIEEETILTGSFGCQYCPYVSFDRNGSCRCWPDQFEKCTNDYEQRFCKE